MPHIDPSPRDPELPRLAAWFLRRLLPHAERDEVLRDLAEEHRERTRSGGSRAAAAWAWRQVLVSAPSLARRGWWRGWSGFESPSNRWKPGGAMFENLGRDVKYALRRLRMRRTYALLTVLTLSLGVAGTAAVYSIAEKLLLEPLPVHAEEEVAVFWMEGSWSEAEFLALRPQIEGFESLAAYREQDVPMQSPGGPARLVKGVAATAELFQVLGTSPAVGPGFRPGDDRQGAEPVVVLSHSLWRELGGELSVVGGRIELGGVTHTVLGVMPEGFWFPDPTVRVWLANELNPDDYSGNWSLLGRLREGVSAQAAASNFEPLMARMHERFDYPEGEWDKRVNPNLVPLRERLVGTIRPSVLATLGAMAVILLIACVNLAALMLGQMDSRGTELSVRTALGASRQSLLQQVAVEAGVIGILSGLVGAGLAVLGFRLFVAALPLGALAESAVLDWPLFGAAIVIALAAALAVALAPMLSLARSDLHGRLARARTSGVAGRGGRLESGLVVGQVALVLLMAAGAALLIRSVQNLNAIDPGVAVEGLAVVDVVMPSATDVESRRQTVREIVAAVGAIPGVESAAATQRLPLRGSSDNWGMAIESRPDLEDISTAFRIVTPEYFDTVGVEVRDGRGLLDTDRLNEITEGTVVINQALADRYFPGVDPIGQRIDSLQRWDRIVGVVANMAESGLAAEPVPSRYMVYEQLPFGIVSGQTIVIRMREGGDPAALLDEARQVIQAQAPEVAIQDLTTMENVFDRAIGPARQVMSLLAILSGLALALGTIGVYGVVSHFVTRRRRDWGIRIALGMRPARVVQRIVGHGGALVAAGVALGTVAFLVLARLLASFLYGVGTADPVSLIGATALLLGAGLLASYVPARRASRIDPAVVLREQ